MMKNIVLLVVVLCLSWNSHADSILLAPIETGKYLEKDDILFFQEALIEGYLGLGVFTVIFIDS